jgi:hypothetical protein
VPSSIPTSKIGFRVLGHRHRLIVSVLTAHRSPAGLTVALVLAVLLAACGSPSRSTASSTVAKRQACKQVEAALSDGPDPEADPVGYAQAQVLPLRGIHASEAKLAGAIGELASAYRQFTANKGATTAQTRVNNATRAIKTLCLGIEP